MGLEREEGALKEGKRDRAGRYGKGRKDGSGERSNEKAGRIMEMVEEEARIFSLAVLN